MKLLALLDKRFSTELQQWAISAEAVVSCIFCQTVEGKFRKDYIMCLYFDE